MPVIKHSTFRAPLHLRNAHIQTILPALFRKLPPLPFQRERLTTDDNDFLDLDWLQKGSDKLLILSHGLEGSSEANYIQGMAGQFYRHSWDVLAWNFRSCSGEMNLQLRFYHSGATDDLHTVVQYALQKGGYTEIVLIGFSLGANVTLKYLGEQPERVPMQVKKAVAFSVPCDLEASAYHMQKWYNKVYMQRFLHTLKDKIRQKSKLFPDKLDTSKMAGMRYFHDFDDAYTAPIHGFESAYDYYSRCSSKQFIKNIKVHTLIINANNDPFLPKECYPIKEAEDNPNVWLEITHGGGHVGFMDKGLNGFFWSDKRAWEFCTLQ